MSIDSKKLQARTAAAENAVRFAKKAGADQADAWVEARTEFRGDVLDGKIENLKQAQRQGLGLRVIADHKVSIVYTSDLRPESLEKLAGRGVLLARQSATDEFAALPEGGLAASKGDLRLFDEDVAALPVSKKIDMALEMERVALGYDKRIKRTDGCSLRTNVGSAHIASTRGGSQAYSGTSVVMFVNPLAEDTAERQQSGAYATAARWLSKIETPEEVGKEAGRRAVARIGARSVPTQKVPVVMHPDIAAGWLQSLFGAFSGENVFKKTSYLAESLGATIASPLVTVIDDGTMPGEIASSPFDGDGLPTWRNVLIDKGVCKMFVYNDYWARKAGAKSTGNAGRSYTSGPTIGNRNLYFANGDTAPADIMKSVDRGFYMVDQGAFGYNPTTGDYSYQAAGFWIEKGVIAYPVQEVTAASNTLEMLANVTKVGNDLRFSGDVNSPTLLISEMTVSGKEASGS
jgi:PmbA protein